ncbi:hypothetical protein [Pontimicrobium sp. MEBiC01747]
METLQKNEGLKDHKENYQLLTAIKEMVKTKSLRTEGFEKLQEIDADELSIAHQIYYYYIKGKYYVLTYKDAAEKDIELLNRGNDCYNDMVAIAFDNNVSIQNPKRHFARAYCKYLLAQKHTSQDVKVKLLNKVKQITDRMLHFKPDNESFIWLQSQL